MSRTYPLLSLGLALTLAPAVSSQLQPPANCRQLAHVDKFPGAVTPINNYAGVWGMVVNNKEYAIVTARTGTIIYDCSVPTAPVEVAFITGPNGGGGGYFWREAAAYGNYAYTSSEHGPLQAINMLANPPALATTFGPRSHTLAIDPDNGRLWANGGNNPNGGCTVFNLVASPTAPPTLGTYSGDYVHDCLPIRGYCYLAQIFAGNMRILNTSAFPPTLTIASTTRTPGAFTHNVWVTDDDRTAVTADENMGGCLTVYDVTNKTLPVQRATWCSPSGATVHNVFIKGQVAHFSSYSAGYYAVDVSDPATPRLIASFDTSTYGGNDYHGCWGAYPFQPSGVIYLNDMQSGFWIVEPTCGVPKQYGAGTAGTNGRVPTLDYAGGFAQVNRTTFGLVSTQVKPNAPVALLLGAAAGSTNVLGITVLVNLGLPTLILSGQADAQGNVSFAVPVPNSPGVANQTFYAQLVSADTAGPQGLAASRGFSVTICP